MNSIVVIGSCYIYITVTADKRPVAGETILGTGLNMSPGGKGANQAVAAAKMGAKVTMVGCIGQDPYGTMVLDNFKKHGIDTTYVQTKEDVPTGTAHITLAEGDNSIIVILGANAAVDEAVVDNAWPAIEKADLVLLQHEIPAQTIAYVLKKCHEQGIKVLLNPAPAAPVSDEALAAAAFVTPNEHELATLYPNQDRDELVRSMNGKLLVTLGKDGVIYGEADQVRRIPAFKVEPVDTTGAGDTFNGAFAAALVAGHDQATAVRYGNAAAALSVLKLGAQEGMPYLNEVEQLLAERG